MKFPADNIPTCGRRQGHWDWKINFTQIKKNYVVVNRMFGDIVKVTPSSKVVGDMALFMTANDYTEKDIFEKGDTISFPDSVIGLFQRRPGTNARRLSQEIAKDHFEK